MAGHSKWAQIKRKKAVTDAARSAVFGKYARLIAAESKRAKGDSNDPQLRTVIERAKAENMPKEAIERAVSKGTSADTASLSRVVYELYGPGGVAVVVSTLTDNTNRTVAEIKHLLSERGYALASPGSAVWAFSLQRGTYEPVTIVPLTEKESVQLEELVCALDAHDDVDAVYTNAA